MANIWLLISINHWWMKYPWLCFYYALDQKCNYLWPYFHSTCNILLYRGAWRSSLSFCNGSCTLHAIILQCMWMPCQHSNYGHWSIANATSHFSKISMLSVNNIAMGNLKPKKKFAINIIFFSYFLFFLTVLKFHLFCSQSWEKWCRVQKNLLFIEYNFSKKY